MVQSDPVLPPCATASDLYLVAIYDVLRQIRDQLTGTTGAPTEGAPVELREPVTPADAPAPTGTKTPPVAAKPGRTRRTSAR